MADKIKTGVEIEVGIKGDASVKSIKAELRQATSEASALAIKFGDNSKEAIEAAKHVAQLRDTIEDTNKRIQAFNPDTFGRIATITQGIAAGFSAAQGAAALFGASAANIEKQMLKVQAAIALSQGLNTLKDLSQQLTAIGRVIIEKVVTSFTTLRGALMATGFGALAIAVGTIAANWEKVSNKVVELVPILGRLGEVWQNVRRAAIGSFAATVEGLKVIGEVVKDIFTLNFKDAVDTARTFGQRTADAYNEALAKEDTKQREAREKLELEAEVKRLEKKLEIEKAYQRNTYALELQVLNMKMSLYAKDTDEYHKALVAKIALQTEHNKKVAAMEAERIRNTVAGLKFEQIQSVGAQQAVIDTRSKLVPINAKIISDIGKQQQTASDEWLKREEWLQENKVMLAASAFGALSALSQAFAGQTEKQQRRMFEINKAMQIAETIISTYSAAQKAYQSQMNVPSPDAPIRAAIAAGIAIAQGLAKVAMIRKTEFNSTSSPSSATSTNAPASISAPSRTAQRGVPTNMTGDEGQQGKELKVYVLEHDISRAQRRGSRLSGAGKVR